MPEAFNISDLLNTYVITWGVNIVMALAIFVIGRWLANMLLIVFRPFKVGNFVEAAGAAGVVQEIGIFSTTLITGDNREIIIPNGSIYSGTITNNSARDTRRVDMVFGIGYDDDIRKAKELLQSILDADERVLKDPAPLIAVGELADSSVNFNVRPWVNAADYWGVMFDVTEKVKLTFDDAGISKLRHSWHCELYSLLRKVAEQTHQSRFTIFLAI
jgi:small-conductance mechanosensitive channel